MKSATSQWQNQLFEVKSNLQLKLYRSVGEWWHSYLLWFWS